MRVNCRNQAITLIEPLPASKVIHFDPVAGEVVGEPFQVSKFETPRLMIPRFIPLVGLSFTKDKIAVTIAQESGSIWMLDGMDQ